MKRSLLFLSILLLLMGCIPRNSMSGSTSAPTETATIAALTPTIIDLTSTATGSPTETATPILPPTLESGQAKDTLRTLLREPMDCEAPCLWGIIPGKTSLSEAISIFVHLGLPIKSIAQGSTEVYGTKYDFDNGLSLLVTLTIRANIVTDLVLDITPGAWESGKPREWLAYSPETLIDQYGVPSKVNFFVGRGPRSTYSMAIYFDTPHVIVEYDSNSDLGLNWQICPLNNQVDYLRIWMGAEPQHPPLDGVLLEEATSKTMEEFTELIIGDPNNACLNLKGEAFP
ncbi:MAG: hypothetical protein HZB50_03905 [Chloroflexi bacterium]|nr:hypothetical protein [Chloroflexota bacterium]